MVGCWGRQAPVEDRGLRFRRLVGEIAVERCSCTGASDVAARLAEITAAVRRGIVFVARFASPEREAALERREEGRSAGAERWRRP